MSERVPIPERWAPESVPCLAFGPDGARCDKAGHDPEIQHSGPGNTLGVCHSWSGGLRLDLGSGAQPAGTVPNPAGPDVPYLGVDLHCADGETVIAVDLFRMPWPWVDASVDAVWCSHFIEHLPPNTYDRDTGVARYPVFDFMAELCRVLKPGAPAVLTWPNLKSERSFQDPTHNHHPAFPTMLYASRAWRTEGGLDHAPYPVECDLHVEGVDMGGPHDRFVERHETAIAVAAEHYWEAFADIRVTLRKPGGEEVETDAARTPTERAMLTGGPLAPPVVVPYETGG